MAPINHATRHVVINRCVKCGNIEFHSWEGYKAHMEQEHKQELVRPIQPINTSGRTKSQIVKDMEFTKLKDYLI